MSLGRWCDADPSRARHQTCPYTLEMLSKRTRALVCTPRITTLWPSDVRHTIRTDDTHRVVIGPIRTLMRADRHARRARRPTGAGRTWQRVRTPPTPFISAADQLGTCRLGTRRVDVVASTSCGRLYSCHMYIISEAVLQLEDKVSVFFGMCLHPTPAT